MRAHRLFKSTSAFLHATFEKRRPTPLIEVSANITLTLPSMLVLSTRKMCWKLDSFMMSDLHRHSVAAPVRSCGVALHIRQLLQQRRRASRGGEEPMAATAEEATASTAATGGADCGGGTLLDGPGAERT